MTNPPTGESDERAPAPSPDPDAPGTGVDDTESDAVPEPNEPA
jgi:hypothetical protein